MRKHCGGDVGTLYPSTGGTSSAAERAVAMVVALSARQRAENLLVLRRFEEAIKISSDALWERKNLHEAEETTASATRRRRCPHCHLNYDDDEVLDGASGCGCVPFVSVVLQSMFELGRAAEVTDFLDAIYGPGALHKGVLPFPIFAMTLSLMGSSGQYEEAAAVGVAELEMLQSCQFERSAAGTFQTRRVRARNCAAKFDTLLEVLVSGVLLPNGRLLQAEQIVRNQVQASPEVKHALEEAIEEAKRGLGAARRAPARPPAGPPRRARSRGRGGRGGAGAGPGAGRVRGGLGRLLAVPRWLLSWRCAAGVLFLALAALLLWHRARRGALARRAALRSLQSRNATAAASSPFGDFVKMMFSTLYL
eukprot:tig00000551_g2027.t1